MPEKSLILQRDRSRKIPTAYFVICNDCFWCASSFLASESSHNNYKTCPTCNETRMEFLPLEVNEPYRFNYSASRGVELQFYQGQRNTARSHAVSAQ